MLSFWQLFQYVLLLLIDSDANYYDIYIYVYVISQVRWLIESFLGIGITVPWNPRDFWEVAGAGFPWGWEHISWDHRRDGKILWSVCIFTACYIAVNKSAAEFR